MIRNNFSIRLTSFAVSEIKNKKQILLYCRNFQWKKKIENKQKEKAVKQFEKELQEQRRNEHLAKKERREENERKKEENRKKAEIVQVVKNVHKLKRMKKKQLRTIEKRDTN